MSALATFAVRPAATLLHAGSHIAPDGTIHGGSESLVGIACMLGYFALSLWLFALALRSRRVAATLPGRRAAGDPARGTGPVPASIDHSLPSRLAASLIQRTDLMASTLGILLIGSLVLVALGGLALSIRQRADAQGPDPAPVQFQLAAPPPPTLRVSSRFAAAARQSSPPAHQDWRSAPLWLRAGIGLLLSATVAVEIFGLGISIFAPVEAGPLLWQQAVIAGVVLACGLLSYGLYRMVARRVYDAR